MAAISTRHFAEFLGPCAILESGTGTIVIVAATVSESLSETATQPIVIVASGTSYLDPVIESGTITLVLVDSYQALFDPESGTGTIVIVPSGLDQLEDSGTGTIVIVGAGTSVVLESGTITFVIFTEARYAVGVFNVKQDRIYNVEIK